MTRDQAFDRFKDACRHVWGDRSAGRLTLKLSPDQPRGDFLAGLIHANVRTWAMPGGADQPGHLLMHANEYMLALSDRLLMMDEQSVWKVLVHEAVHIGVGPHNADFRAICRLAGGAVSELAVEQGGNVVQIQRQDAPGKRFHTVHTVEDEKEAVAWVKANQGAQPGRYRLLMGVEAGDDALADGALGDDLATAVLPPDRYGGYAYAKKDAPPIVQEAQQKLAEVLAALGSFVPVYGVNTSAVNLLALSFDDDFLLEGGGLPPAKLKQDAHAAWQGLDELGLIADVLDPKIDGLYENPDRLTIPAPLAAWIRLVLPHAYLADVIKASDPFEHDPDLVFWPRLLFAEKNFKAGIHWVAMYWERPQDCAPKLWGRIRKGVMFAEQDLVSGGVGGDENWVRKKWHDVARANADGPCRAALDALAPQFVVVTTAQLHAYVDEVLSRGEAPSEHWQSRSSVKVPLIAKWGAGIVVYEDAMADFKAKRDEWARDHFLPTPVGLVVPHRRPPLYILPVVEGAGPLYFGWPGVPDPDRRHVIVPPLDDIKTWRADVNRENKAIAQFWKFSSVDPTGRPVLHAGTLQLERRGVRVDEVVAAESDGLLKAGFTSARGAFDWDWAKIFERYAEQDQDYIQEAHRAEYDALCWEWSTATTKEEALEWIQRRNARNQARMARGGPNLPTYPEDWEGAYQAEPYEKDPKGRQVVMVPGPGGHRRLIPSEQPPLDVMIALGLRVFPCKSGENPSIAPLWFHLACRAHGVPTGDDWVGHDRLVLFDYLRDLYLRGFEPEKDEQVRAFLAEMAPHMDPTGHLWQHLSTQDQVPEEGGGPYGEPGTRVIDSIPDTAVAVDAHMTKLGLGASRLSFFHVTTKPFDCQHGIGSRNTTCCRYDAFHDEDLATLIPDGPDSYLVIRRIKYPAAREGGVLVGDHGLFIPVDPRIEEGRIQGKYGDRFWWRKDEGEAKPVLGDAEVNPWQRAGVDAK